MILCIETATTNCSVALFKDDECIGLKENSSSGYSHNEQLHVFIQDVLKQANVQLDQLEAVAVSKGPGSYTGLRIGVSAAKGLCFSLSIPLIAINTLTVLAQSALGSANFIIPMIDARRMEVYSCIFDQKGNALSSAHAEILKESSYANYLVKGTVRFIGNGVEKWKKLCPNPNAAFSEGVLPSAKNMGSLAKTYLIQKEFVDVAYFEPYYLKDFKSYIDAGLRKTQD